MPTLEELLRDNGAALRAWRETNKGPLDCSGATLTEVVCRRIELGGIKLIGAVLGGCHFEAIRFHDTDLSNAHIRDCTLRWCDFRAANLTAVKFENVGFSECDFSYAPGLETVIFDDCELDRVIGVGQEEQRLDDSNDDRPLLRTRLPPGYGSMPLTELLDAVARHATVTCGSGMSEADVKELEVSFRMPFPDDYRSFLRTCGSLRLDGDSGYSDGAFEVHGADLTHVHARFVAAYDENHGWFGAVSVPSPPPKMDLAGFFDIGAAEPGFVPSTLEEKRAALRDELLLSDEHVVAFCDDGLDKSRVAYQFMVPIMTWPAMPDMQFRIVECAGPGRRVYTVLIHSDDVSSPSRTFASRLRRNIGRLVVNR